MLASKKTKVSRSYFRNRPSRLHTGGFGYMREYDVERYFRECRMLTMAPVSQEMVLNMISEHVLKLPRSY